MSEPASNSEYHPLLLRQMGRCGITGSGVPSPNQLRQLLDRVSTSYRDAEQDRYLLERSLDLSSREMHYSIELESNRLHAVVNSTEDCICTLDEQGNVTWANPAALRILRMDSPESTVFCFPARIEPLPQAGSGSSGNSHQSRAVLRTLGEDGVPIAYTRNKIAGGQESVLAFRDISVEQQHELALLRAREAADAASKAKSQLLDNISHEVRTPMHGILCMVQLLSQSDLPADEQSFLKNLRVSAENLLELLNNILELSRCEAGQLTIASVPFALQAVAEEVRQLVLPDANAKSLPVVCRFEGGSAWVVGDPNRLRQILLNLARNAVKFTEAGFVEISLRTVALPDGMLQADFHVRDTGIGILPDQQQSIFESFTQADSSITRRFGGAGLGLAIASHIASQMNSRIAVVSAPGEGSNFSFTLHLKATRREQEELPPLNILYAEDNPINQLTARRMLTAKGHRIHIVGNGREAVEAVKRETFDLILMDNQMPELSGIEATRLIRRLGFNLPIVAVTASTHVGDRALLLDAGMNEFVAKPFTLAELQSAMSRALSVCA